MSKKAKHEPNYDHDPDKIINTFRDAMKEKDVAQINAMILEENVLHRDSCGDTFLHIAAASGSVELALQLLQLGSNVHAQNHNNKTPLFYAMQNSYEMVKILLDNRTVVDSTLLRHALFYRSEDTVRLLLQKAIFFENSSQITFNRTRSRCKEQQEYLDDFEATENLINVFLHVKKYLLSKEKYYPLLIFFAAKIGKENVLQLILDDCREYLSRNNKKTKGSTRSQQELNVQGDSGETSLHYAISVQHVDAVRFLLDKGADPNVRTRGELTPLHYAARLGNQEICQLLVTFGATIDCSDWIHACYYTTRFPCLDEFGFNGLRNLKINFVNKEIMNFLLTNGADLRRQVEDSGELLEACQANRLEEIKIRIKFGANIRTVDDNGNSALHYAVLGSSYQTIDFLLEMGLEIDMTNILGETPLLILIRWKSGISQTLIEYLVDRGASLSVKNRQGITFFHYALHSRNTCKNISTIILNLLELGADKAWKKNSDPEVPDKFYYHYHYHCCSSRRKTAMEPYGNAHQVLISYIACKGNNINDYTICCLKYKNREQASLIYNNTKLELGKLKLRKISEDIQSDYTYYDFLTQDIVPASRIIKNSTMKLELSNPHNYRDFPCCKFLFYHRFKLLEVFADRYDRVVNFFLNYGKVKLSFDVIEIILCHLSPRDFRVFDRILEKSEN